MKTLLTLVFIYMLCSEVFQASAALQCYQCGGMTCDPEIVTCSPAERCFTSTVKVAGQKHIAKGCVPQGVCASPAASTLMECCNADLCNGAEGVKLSLLIMLVPLISSILFL